MIVRHNDPQFLPTPQEIRSLCAQFQAGWSDQERVRRRSSLTEAERQQNRLTADVISEETFFFRRDPLE